MFLSFLYRSFDEVSNFCNKIINKSETGIGGQKLPVALYAKKANIKSM